MTTKSNSDDALLGEQAGVSVAEQPKRARKSGGNPPGNDTFSERSKTNLQQTAGRPAASKSNIVVSKLRAAKGATIEMLMTATGWQAHSVRGFLSGTVRKKLGLPLESEIGKDGQRRYRLAK